MSQLALQSASPTSRSPELIGRGPKVAPESSQSNLDRPLPPITQQQPKIADCGYAADSLNETLRDAILSLAAVGLPSHLVIAAALGAGGDFPLVAIEKRSGAPIVNTDLLPPSSDPEAPYTLAAQLARALCLCDMRAGLGTTRAGAHPLLGNDRRRLPALLHDLAVKIPAFAGFAAHYMGALTLQCNRDGILFALRRHTSAFIKAIGGTFGAAIMERDLPDLPVPAGPNEAIWKKYLRVFQPCLFSGCYPDQVIGLSFYNTLSIELANAIAVTCKERKLPAYSGDPWNTIAALNTYPLSEDQQALIRNFKVEGYPVSDWVRESQSSFFRRVGSFWEGFGKHMDVLCRRALQRRENTLRVTVVGVGMNEEPLSVAMATQLFLEKSGLADTLNFEIKVLSRENPTMKALIQARQREQSAPIVYPHEQLPYQSQYANFFKPSRGGYAPSEEISSRISYQIVDLTSPGAAEHTGPPADLLLVHNVFQYIHGKENRLCALTNINKLCRHDGFVSLAGDAFNFGQDQDELGKLRLLTSSTRCYGSANLTP
jgi:chemotaxis methyl-accepting protein methylase